MPEIKLEGFVFTPAMRQSVGLSDEYILPRPMMRLCAGCGGMLGPEWTPYLCAPCDRATQPSRALGGVRADARKRREERP